VKIFQVLNAGLNKPLFAIIAGLTLVVAAIGCRYAAFMQTAFATGWDSYFYLVQLKSIVETGQMHSPEGSLIYPFLRLLYGVTHDYVAALKWGAALLCGLWTGLLFYLPRSRNMGLLLAAWAVFSPQLTYFAAQYPKNLLGIVLFAAFVLSIERAGKQRVILALILLIVNYFGHRMTFGLCLVYGLLTLLFQWKKTSLPKWISPMHVLLATLCFGLLFIAGRFIPGLASLTDFHRLDGTFSIVPQLAPWSFVSTFGLGKISGWWLFELGVTLLLLLVTGLQSVKKMWGERRADAQELAMLTLCVLLLFPFLTWTFLGLSWRFFLVFVLLAPLLLREKLFQKVYWAFIPCLLAGAFFSWKSYSPALHDPNYSMFSRVTRNVEKHFDQGAKPELVIAHNALAEYFTFTTGVDAMPWLPEYPIDSMRLWRIATGVRYETLQYYAGPPWKESVFPLGGGYHLLPEFVWQKACSSVRNAGDEDAFVAAANSWHNPHQMRPAWLLHRKK
jgi:hypothetical protein